MKRRARFLLATWGGVGLLPVAPGTFGALAAVPVHYLLSFLNTWAHLVIVLALMVMGTIAAHGVAVESGEEDPQIIVVDESTSVLLGLWIALPCGWMGWIGVFVLFRILDIFKPWPINVAEQLRPAGLGIMADDAIAGVVAGLLILFGYQFLPFAVAVN